MLGLTHRRVWCCRAWPGSSLLHTSSHRSWVEGWSRSESVWSVHPHSAYHSGTRDSSETTLHPLPHQHTNKHEHKHRYKIRYQCLCMFYTIYTNQIYFTLKNHCSLLQLISSFRIISIIYDDNVMTKVLVYSNLQTLWIVCHFWLGLKNDWGYEKGNQNFSFLRFLI